MGCLRVAVDLKKSSVLSVRHCLSVAVPPWFYLPSGCCRSQLSQCRCAAVVRKIGLRVLVQCCLHAAVVPTIFQLY
ncbi:hypothetical protein RCIA169 [Methanocella arvoryzae MRE50]|uniref:Uncharacterized protein n=1 Tax=Methanocella arvoryzae (strain DSM 22066 / NBRC 105507 / MRE50) TaxID=351160 RepID=Q0W2D3_METAR|nr:hypothetical protein RCIA169 [Methanocella arvoryzae MRE50]